MAAPAGLVVAIGLCFVVVAAGAVRVARAARRRLRALPAREALTLGEGGSVVVVESMFTLLVLFLVTLVMLQLCLGFAAFQVVNLAAYRTARSAAVIVPQECENEGVNRLAPDGISAKRNTLRRAAALTTIAISPPFLDEVTARYGSEAVTRWFDTARAARELSDGLGGLGDAARLPERYLYASEHTAVRVEGKEGDAAFGPDELIEVAVRYRFALRVPVAGRLLGRRLTWGPFTLGYFTDITCRCTIANEGYPTAEPRLSRPPADVRAAACGDAQGAGGRP